MGNPRGSQLGDLGELQSELADLREEVAELGRLRVADNVTEDWLQIPFRFVSLASGATAVLTRTVSGDGPFDLIEVTSTAVSSTGIVNDNWRIRIKEGEAVGRALTQDNEFVDLANSSGTGQRPYIIKGRRRFRANIAIVIEVTNTLPGPALNTLELVLHGIKVFTR